MKKLILSVWVFLFCINPIFSQITQLDWEFSGIPNSEIRCIEATSSNVIFVGSDEGLYKSNNSGVSWENCTGPAMQNDIKCIHISSSDDIWVGSRAGLFMSADQGANWTQKYSSDTLSQVDDIITQGNKVFITVRDSVTGFDNQSVFLSEDYGNTWNEIDTGIIGLSRISYFVADTSGAIFSHSEGGTITYEILYKWDELNSVWNAVYTFPPNFVVYDIEVTQDDYFVGSESHGSIISFEHGADWSAIGLYPITCDVVGIIPGNEILIGTRTEGVYYTSDLGTSWTQFKDGLPENIVSTWLVDPITALCHASGRIFVGTRDHGVYMSSQLVGNVSQQVDNAQLRLYPNPTRDVLNIDFGNEPTAAIEEIKIFNQLGELLFHRKYAGIYNERIKIPLDDFKGGMYFLQVNRKNELLNAEFIVAD